MLEEIGKDCPILLKILDPRLGFGNVLDDEDEQSSSAVEGDSEHQTPLALKAINSKIVVRRPDELLQVVSPGKLAITHIFINKLRNSYQTDYNIPAPTVFTGSKLQWAERFSFAKPRYVLASRRPIVIRADVFKS
jgi:hypothetical protein